MALIIDADVIIGGERGQFDLPTWLENQAENDPQIAGITIAELWQVFNVRHRVMGLGAKPI